ncbi:MAG: cytochrome c biogenesis protein ResB [Nitrospirae bacterium]|nr:cytochrome c biogenesis protein ResB [Nitrospirota bacterium]
MEEDKNKTVVDKIWDFFASITLAVVLFALIALTSIIGTILEQNAAPEKNIKLLGKLFGDSLAPTLYPIFEKLGFMDMYHSWWFVTLLLLFATNLIICSIDRLPRIWKLIKDPIRPLPEEHFKNVGIKKEFLLKGKTESIKNAFEHAIKKIGFKLLESKGVNGYQLYSEKGNYTRLGVYITHLSILLMLLGAIIGIFFGFKGSINLPEGKTYAMAFVRGKAITNSADEFEMDTILDALQATEGKSASAAKKLGIDEKTFEAKLKRYGVKPLGFSIRCDNFATDYYGGSNMPKEYRSWLTVIKEGKEVMKKSIVVNDPLNYGGITFYQSSYGMVPGAKGIFILKLTSKTGVSEIKKMPFGEKFIIPGTDLEGALADFSPALAFEPTGRPFTSGEQMTNPAVLIAFTEKGKPKYSGWIMKRYPETGRLPEGHIVELIDYWGVEYTGLSVRKDPGVLIVYLGFAAMGIGLFTALFMSHKKLWVRLVDEKNSTRVIIALSANKNRPAFERKVDKMIALLSKSGEGENQ